jgi:hypothetical protein
MIVDAGAVRSFVTVRSYGEVDAPARASMEAGANRPLGLLLALMRPSAAGQPADGRAFQGQRVIIPSGSTPGALK